ncbi:P-loop NTPase fold protein [Flavobacterium magnesitis]|uniref:KAP family P-loop NTPase fold protein n=1 Tax=Flavobacterium magnesitis TaxID=3138077 RepID=UPI00358EBA95
MSFKDNKIVILFKLIKVNLSIISSWIIFSIITLLFQSKISSFISNNSVITNKEVKNDNFNFAFTLLIFIILIRFLWFIIKNYRISKKHNYLIFFICMIYLFIRNNEDDQLLFSFYNVKWSIYYSDIILLISFLSSILLIRNVFYSNCKLYDILIKWFDNLKTKPEVINTSFLLEDIPFEETNSNDNELVINQVVVAIKNLKPISSFIIGVNSIWGVGKTSFLKRVEYKLRNEPSKEYQPITFWFNAWQHQDEKSIINNFFNQLKTELSKYSGDSESVIDNYLKQMMALVDNKYINFLKSITESVFSVNDNTIKRFYDDINEIIEKVDRKIIVFVDDIDRLNKNEILETLRILRNIADFKNVVFICGFDREYVVKQSQIDNHYLDKIFNLEISLTVQNQRGFVIYLIELIMNSSGYNHKDKDLLTSSINRIFYNNDELGNINLDLFLDLHKNEQNKNKLNANDFDKLEQIQLIPSFFFESRRDVKKFFNELFINIKTLKKFEDIELDEYILLKLLFFRYKWIYKNFTSKRIGSWLGNQDTLKFEQQNLDKLIINSEVENQDKFIIYSIIKSLFPPTAIDSNFKNINQKRYFPIYFGNNVFNESFSYTELTNALENLTIENLINDKVLGNENEYLIKNDIKKFVLKYENIKSIDEYKQVIKLIKKELIGSVDEVEILDFIYLGETVFDKEYGEILLDTIFTNFDDSFGQFMYELSLHYSKTPKNISLHRQNNIGSHVNSKKIDALKILNQRELLIIMLKIVPDEIEKNKNDLNKVLSFFNFFYEIHYPFFYFGLFFENIKTIAKQYIEDQFQILFLSNSTIESFSKNIDYKFIANLFEDLKERESIIKTANSLISERNKWTDSDLSLDEYVIKGMDNFIFFVEGIKNSIDSNKVDEYNNFLEWLYVYQKKLYIRMPSNEDILIFRQDKEANR